MLKQKVKTDAPKNVRALKSSIRAHWRTVNEEFLTPYFESMIERVDMYIEKKGGKIPY